MTLEATGTPKGKQGDYVSVENEGFSVKGVIRNIIRVGNGWLISFVSGETFVERDDGTGRMIFTERRTTPRPNPRRQK